MTFTQGLCRLKWVNEGTSIWKMHVSYQYRQTRSTSTEESWGTLCFPHFRGAENPSRTEWDKIRPRRKNVAIFLVTELLGQQQVLLWHFCSPCACHIRAILAATTPKTHQVGQRQGKPWNGNRANPSYGAQVLINPGMVVKASANQGRKAPLGTVWHDRVLCPNAQNL